MKTTIVRCPAVFCCFVDLLLITGDKITNEEKRKKINYIYKIKNVLHVYTLRLYLWWASERSACLLIIQWLLLWINALKLMWKDWTLHHDLTTAENNMFIVRWGHTNTTTAGAQRMWTLAPSLMMRLWQLTFSPSSPSFRTTNKNSELLWAEAKGSGHVSTQWLHTPGSFPLALLTMLYVSRHLEIGFRKQCAQWWAMWPSPAHEVNDIGAVDIGSRCALTPPVNILASQTSWNMLTNYGWTATPKWQEFYWRKANIIRSFIHMTSKQSVVLLYHQARLFFCQIGTL